MCSHFSNQIVLIYIFLLGCRCENYAITLLEQCENLGEVENFLQTKPSQTDGPNTNYILAILDSRKKFVAHERFQYVLLKMFGETDLPVSFCMNIPIYNCILAGTTFTTISSEIRGLRSTKCSSETL